MSDFLKSHPLLRRFAIDFLLGAAFNTIIALVVTHIMRVDGTFAQNWVFSMCIGGLALLFIDGIRLRIWHERQPSMMGLAVVIIVAAPSAYVGGSLLAATLLGLPRRALKANFSPDSIGLLILTMLCCLFGAWFYTSRTRILSLRAEAAAERARSSAIEKQAMQAQLQLLQAQIEPHMLFNTLANLQGLIAIDTGRAQHMLDQLILYLRASLKSSRVEHTTLKQEFALLEAYLGLMSVRMGARLAFSLALPDELARLRLPPMLLQPLVENAIQHGLEPKVGGGRIDVSASLHGGQLILRVADTGLGLQETPATAGTGVGLANVRERLEALYGPAASFVLNANPPQGVVAELTLPGSP